METSIEDMVIIRNLEVVYSNFHLGPVTLSFSSGIHALLGENGAGKSTLLRALLGLQRPDAGKSIVLGFDCSQRNPHALAKVGIVVDSRIFLPQELTAREYWHLIASLRTRKDTRLFESFIGQSEKLASDLRFFSFDMPIANLSLGNAKKVQIVGALLHSPDFIIMDEPKSGLDPLSVELFENLVDNLKVKGKSILIASHDLRWAQEKADYIHILHEGDVVLSDSSENLFAQGNSLLDVYKTATLR